MFPQSISGLGPLTCRGEIVTQHWQDLAGKLRIALAFAIVVSMVVGGGGGFVLD